MNNKVRNAIRDYMVFEEETSIDYPFLLTYDELSEVTLSAIASRCAGHDDTETIYEAIMGVIGPMK